MADCLAAPLTTMLDVLEHRARTIPDSPLYTWLEDGESEAATETFGSLRSHARAIGSVLQQLGVSGRNVVLMYPFEGLDFVVAFWACLVSGVVAVPTYPPDPTRLHRSLKRFEHILRDCECAAVMTTSEIAEQMKQLATSFPLLARLKVVATDCIDRAMESSWTEPQLTQDSLAFLQYTSGSTGAPKGVMVTHGSLVSNLKLIMKRFEIADGSRLLCWLPLYHDMGLIGFVSTTCIAGSHLWLMSPISFIKKPLRWLKAITEKRIQITGGPNFAFDLCCRRVPESQAKSLDFSSLEVLFTGAEPVRPASLGAFLSKFSSRGLKGTALMPVYGLAESTLFVTGVRRESEPVYTSFSIEGIATGKAVVATDGPDSRVLASCGSNPEQDSHPVRIVDCSTMSVCPEGSVGEVWVSGPSVAAGYWKKPEVSESTFRAKLAVDDGRVYLRTGDLGFMHHGDLYICGRQKDIAAFSVDTSAGEQLVIVAEAVTEVGPEDAQKAIAAICEAVNEEHEVQPKAVVLIKAGTICKTSSGKIQRHACKEMLVNNGLEVVSRWPAEAKPGIAGSIDDDLLEELEGIEAAAAVPQTPDQQPADDVVDDECSEGSAVADEFEDNVLGSDDSDADLPTVELSGANLRGLRASLLASSWGMPDDLAGLNDGEEEEVFDEFETGAQAGSNLGPQQKQPAASQQPQQQQAPASKPTVYPQPPAQQQQQLQKKLHDLDPQKQKYLLRVLEQLEREESLAAGQDMPKMSLGLNVASRAPAAQQPASAAPQAHGRVPVPTSAGSARSVVVKTGILTVRALTNWGHATLCGLGRVELLDELGRRVRADPACVRCDRPPTSGDAAFAALVAQSALPPGADERASFVCRVPGGGADRLFELSVQLPRNGQGIAQVHLWNFNSRTRELSIGVKDVQVLLDGVVVWQGVLQRGTGNPALESATVVSLRPAAPAKKPSPVVIPADPSSQGRTRSGSVPSELSPVMPASPSTQSPAGTPRDGAASAAARRKTTSGGGSKIPTLKSESGTSAVASTAQHKPPIWLSGGSPRRKRDDIDLDEDDDVGDEVLPAQVTRAPANAANAAPVVGAGTQQQQQQQAAAGQARGKQTKLEFDDMYIPTVVEEPSSVRRSTSASSSKGDLVHAKASGGAQVHAGPAPVGEGTARVSKLSLAGVAPVQPKRITPRGSQPAQPPQSVSPAPQAQQSSQQAIPKPIVAKKPPYIAGKMPSGKQMVINMTSTWGDPYYIGLSGLDMFDEAGRVVRLGDVKRQLRADPPDINILEGYSNDPRTIDKLVDGVSRTCDDYHVWLAPFTEGKSHTITVDFDGRVTLSLLRFWNYNKSRIHSYRGARDVEVTLDGEVVFRGEIKKAPGNLHRADACAEYVLFTTDDAVLAAIEANDPCSPQQGEQRADPVNRPSTQGANLEDDEQAARDEIIKDLMGDGCRPMTKAMRRPAVHPQSVSDSTLAAAAKLASVANKAVAEMTVRRLVFNFRETWGDPYYMGLTGLRLYDPDLKPIALEMSNMWASPKDINELPECSGDDRTLDKLIDGVHVTTDDHHMWMIPFTPGQDHLLAITFDAPRRISCMRVWNYNKTPDDSYRGAKRVVITADDRQITPADGILLRKARTTLLPSLASVLRAFPVAFSLGLASREQLLGIADAFLALQSSGDALFDFGQCVNLAELARAGSSAVQVPPELQAMRGQRARPEILRQGFDMPLLPSGFVFKFVFLSTWGDPFFVGLNGLELYDWRGEKLPVSTANCEAIPRSINVLPDVKNDPRTLDKLFDGQNDTFNDMHMWLAPFTPGQANLIVVWFDEPVALGMVKFWNYVKTPARGVEDFELFADDVLVFKGVLQQSPPPPQQAGKAMDLSQTVLFTNDDRIFERERRRMLAVSDDDQHVQFINNRQVMIPASSRKASAAHAAKRPKTSAVGEKPGSLMMGGAVPVGAGAKMMMQHGMAPQLPPAAPKY
eukprot:m51a1_g2027 putative long-chain-fatty-acid-- ligase (1959) ;mRNA; r:1299220-1309113